MRLTQELELAMAERVIMELAPLEGEGRLGALLLQLTPAFAPKTNQLAELEPLRFRFWKPGLARVGFKARELRSR